jgi:starch-binding outer membrane protein, SusD/RagB family
MKTRIITLIFLIGLILPGCNKFLDMNPTDRLSDKMVWQNAESVELYVNGFYPYINIYGAFGDGDSQVGLTEGLTETLKYGSMTPGTHVGFANIVAYSDGGMSAPTAAFHLGMWDALYTRIRRVNEFLYGLHKYGTNLDMNTKTRFEAEARFFRGFLYFQLIKRSSDVILYDEDLSKISKTKALSTEVQGWEMVQADLDFAAKNLPKTWTGANTGRVSKGCCICNAIESNALCKEMAGGKRCCRFGDKSGNLRSSKGKYGSRLPEGIQIGLNRKQGVNPGVQLYAKWRTYTQLQQALHPWWRCAG